MFRERSERPSSGVLANLVPSGRRDQSTVLAPSPFELFQRDLGSSIGTKRETLAPEPQPQDNVLVRSKSSSLF